MFNNINIVETYKKHPFAKYLLILAGIVLTYGGYRVYIWVHTESTDNAYIDIDMSNVSSEINGVITKVIVLNNTKVQKGDLIAKIDDRDYKARLITLESSINSSIQNIKIIEQKILIGRLNLQQSQESLNLAKVNLEIVSSDFSRTKELHKENFASDKLFDSSKNVFEKAKTDHNQAKLNFEISEQNLKLLELEKNAEEETLIGLKGSKEIAKRSLDNTSITAPISGIFSNSSLEVGNYISPGRILFSIIPMEKIYITANFKETQVEKLRSGLKVKVQFDSSPKKVIHGKIRNISPATGSKFSLIPPDNATGNFTKIVQRVPVVIDFELPDNGSTILVPGMSANVSIRTDQKVEDNTE